MACFSTSLEDVVSKSEDARKQVEALQNGLNKSADHYKNIFKNKRDQFFNNIGLTDVKNDDVNENIKVEFASEFSLDKIIPVVKAAIDAAAAIYNPVSPITDKTRQAFSDLVVAIGECAKFSSSAASTMSFASSRLSPGLFVSLYAGSVTIEDRNMFGKKAVTATIYYYQLSKSDKDIENDMNRELLLMYTQSVISLNKKILELAESVANGEMTFEDFAERKETIRKLINQQKPVVAATKKESASYQQAVSGVVQQERTAARSPFSEAVQTKIKGLKESLNIEELVKEYNDSLDDLLK